MSTSQELDLDHTPLTFGKHRGETPDEISEYDPAYVVWIYNNIKPHPCSSWLAERCKEDMQYPNEEEDIPDELY